jgi:hypothetical protein
VDRRGAEGLRLEMRKWVIEVLHWIGMLGIEIELNGLECWGRGKDWICPCSKRVYCLLWWELSALGRSCGMEVLVN